MGCVYHLTHDNQPMASWRWPMHGSDTVCNYLNKAYLRYLLYLLHLLHLLYLQL